MAHTPQTPNTPYLSPNPYTKPTLYEIVKAESDVPLELRPKPDDFSLLFRAFGDWLNEFINTLKTNGDYEKYSSYMYQLLKIMVAIRKEVNKKCIEV